MKALLKCKCTDGEVSLDMRDRDTYEDIRDYMQYVQVQVSKWHRDRGCTATSLEYMKLPVTEGKPLGVSE